MMSEELFAFPWTRKSWRVGVTSRPSRPGAGGTMSSSTAEESPPPSTLRRRVTCSTPNAAVHPADKCADVLLGVVAPPERHAQARTITAMAEAQWRYAHSIRMPLIMDRRGGPAFRLTDCFHYRCYRLPDRDS